MPYFYVYAWNGGQSTISPLQYRIVIPWPHTFPSPPAWQLSGAVSKIDIGTRQPVGKT